MKKVLITGIKGFVGFYLKEELKNHNYEVFGIDLKGEDERNYFKCDIINKDKLVKIVNLIEPSFVFHLAGFSNSIKSVSEPEKCFKINVNGTANLIEAIKPFNSKLLVISSAEVYGKPKYNPIDENHPINPIRPYSHTRIEMEKLGLEYGNAVVARPFNHTGPGQSIDFFIPSIKKQIVDAKEGDTIYVGNLDAIRDFSDVRDVVKAYRLLIEKAKPGEVYNIGSGIGYKLGSIVMKLISDSRKNIRIEISPDKYRKQEIYKVICDNAKIKKLGAKFKKLF